MITLLNLVTMTLVAPVVGFSSAGSFDDTADHGGGSGYAFTGSPLAHGMDCATCHQNGDDRFDVLLFSTPPGLFDTGYVPGTAYDIQVAMIDERAGRDRDGACAPGLAGCNRNSFAAEFLTATGTPAGLLCPDGDPLGGALCDQTSAPLTTLTDGGAIVGRSLAVPALCNPLVEPTGPCIDLDAFVAAGYTQPQIDEYIAAEVRGAHRWAFRWRAPMGSDPVELYLGVVDGDGGNRLDPAFADYQGDGVLMRQKTLWPTGSSTSDVKPAAVGCQAGIGGLPAALLLLLLAGLLTGLTRRRHRMALASAVVSSLVLFAAPQNVRAQTSCDIITGASCGWGEGCDCDHDGYVRSSAEAKRYCRYTRCPLDGDDRNPNVLGVPSVYNADGDGFTRDYDCDDSNQCINGACNNICGATTPPPPPPAPDTSVGTNMSDTSTTNGSDTYNVQDWLNDTNRTTSGPINAGAVDHATPPGPGCAGGTTDGVPSWVIVLSLLVGLTLIRRRRTRLVAAVLALAVAQVGCATTRPWERGQLAHGAMTFAGDGLEGQLEQHVLQYREGAAGGFGGGGGGCGCN